MKIKLSLGCGLILLFINFGVFASWDKRPEINFMQLYRYDLRQDNHKLYINRFSTTFNYLSNKVKSLFKLTPFFEIRRNINKDCWERKELGIELGKDIFSWLYFGEAIQKGWQKEDYRYYANYERRDYAELETRLLLKLPLLSHKYIKLKGFILNEYTYDLDRGAGKYNEVAIGLIVPIGRYMKTDINWRHIDRIHYYDSDVFEASLTLIF